ncbi:MAG: DUF2630 family protein [Beggiatoa sp.]|nr:DUF2630 family protein [Beggiatoa sp.]
MQGWDLLRQRRAERGGESNQTRVRDEKTVEVLPGLRRSRPTS